MTRNHLPGGADMAQFGNPIGGQPEPGTRLRARILGRRSTRLRRESLRARGEYAWGGAASTAFWVDPAEELTVSVLHPALPSTTYPIRRELKQLVYSAIVD